MVSDRVHRKLRVVETASKLTFGVQGVCRNRIIGRGGLRCYVVGGTLRLEAAYCMMDTKIGLPDEGSMRITLPASVEGSNTWLGLYGILQHD